MLSFQTNQYKNSFCKSLSIYHLKLHITNLHQIEEKRFLQKQVLKSIFDNVFGVLH